jgi:hypothetical protein
MPEKFVVAVKAAGLSGPEVQSVLADTIWFMSVALEDKLEGADKLVPKEGRARLVEMTREAMQAAVRPFPHPCPMVECITKKAPHSLLHTLAPPEPQL